MSPTLSIWVSKHTQVITSPWFKGYVQLEAMDFPWIVFLLP